MSDEKLRELERRWKETGSVEDEAAWLKERVRVGDLTQERLELAARLGLAAASLAIEGSQGSDRADRGDPNWRELVVLAAEAAYPTWWPYPRSESEYGWQCLLAYRRFLNGQAGGLEDAIEWLEDTYFEAEPDRRTAARVIIDAGRSLLSQSDELAQQALHTLAALGLDQERLGPLLRALV